MNEQGDLVGIISEADILKILDDFPWYASFSKILHILEEHDVKRDIEKVSNMKVGEVMSKNPKIIKADDLVSDASLIMHSHVF